MLEQEFISSCSCLFQEIHILARKYHWDYFTCLKLSIRTRECFVKMILDELKAEREAIDEASGKSSVEKERSYREGS